MSKIKASIDIGSNSVLLLVKDGSSILENKATVTALGKGIDLTKRFNSESMDNTFLALSEYKKLINKYNVDNNNIVVTATEASRVVENAKDFFKKIKNELGLEVKIISGEQEAYFSTKGVLSSGYENEVVTILDIGGASTELIKARVKPFEVLEFVSIPIGAVRVSDNESKLEYIAETISKYNLEKYKGEVLIATAGTMTSLAGISFKFKKYDDEKVHNSILDIKVLENIEDEIYNKTSEQIEEMYPFLGKRSTTIYSGLLLAKEILKEMNFLECIVSSRGLRYGTIEADDII